MKVAIFGLGDVGMTAAACLTHEGHEVVGVDRSDEKIATVNAGRSPIVEPGLQDLVETAASKGLLVATHDAVPSFESCAMATVRAGTRSAPGSII